MSLLRLLTNGKSLVGIKNPEHRYRATKGAWLPRFGGQQNPFTSATTEDAKPVVDAAQPKGRSKTDADAKPKTLAAIPVFKQAQPLPRLPINGGTMSPAVVVKKLASGAKSAGKWLAAVNPFSIATPQRSAGARRATPIQGELYLDQVKVMRNDLSDADLEVVPLRSSAANAARAGATSTDVTAWGQLSSGPAPFGQSQIN